MSDSMAAGTMAYQVSVTQAVEEFIVMNGLDEYVAKILRESDPDIQREVLDRGPLEPDARGPNPMVMGRIGRARRAKNKTLREEPPPPTKDKLCPIFLEKGKCKYGQSCFLAHGNAELGASNSHIREGRFGKGQVVDDGDIALFIADNNVDERSAATLRDSSKDIQRRVLSGGPIINTDNPSLILVKRIANAKRKKAEEEGLVEPNGGGWGSSRSGGKGYDSGGKGGMQNDGWGSSQSGGWGSSQSGGWGSSQSGGWGDQQSGSAPQMMMQQMVEMNMNMMQSMTKMQDMMVSMATMGQKGGQNGGKGGGFGKDGYGKGGYSPW